MNNMPELKIGVVAVSRDCFPESLSVNRRRALIDAYTKKYGEGTVYECPVCIVESEIHMVQALEDIKREGCNALAVYLGNFGPEISETLLAKHFDGPKMFIADPGRLNTGTRGRILRHAQRKLQPEASGCKGVHTRVSGRDCGGMCGYDP